MINRNSPFRLSAIFFAGLVFGFWMMAPDDPSRSIGDGIKNRLPITNMAYAQESEAKIAPTKVSARLCDTYYPNTGDRARRNAGECG
jgi:hypothetical protein